MIIRHSFEPRDNVRLAHLCGSFDEHLRNIEEVFNVSVSRRNEFFRIDGPAQKAQGAMALLQSLYEHADSPIEADRLQITMTQALAELSRTKAGRTVGPQAAAMGATKPGSNEIELRTRRVNLAGRTVNQLIYLNNILAQPITFGIGPAGTGKTFLAVACAVDALERNTVQRIILTRPAVEAGERLGFLPGDLAQKVDPFLRPLYDALDDLMGPEKVSRAIERGTIEIAPLAFMRGRTLNHAFVILDEAQNSTVEQMKMFLTRIGVGTKVVVNGDVSQVDLPHGVQSGLIDAERVLRRVSGIAITRFASTDVVRHPLVARIVDAYDASRLGEA